MYTAVQIANRALSRLGADRITGLDQATKPAREISAIFDMVRDAEIQRGRWKFSIARTTLSADAARPAWGYSYAYNLPADYLGLVQVGQVYVRGTADQASWAVEGRKILSNVGPALAIRYKQRVEDTRQFPALFVEALSLKLAYEACEALTQSTSKQEAIAQAYQRAVLDAMRSDALEIPPDELPRGSWLDARSDGVSDGFVSDGSASVYPSGFLVA